MKTSVAATAALVSLGLVIGAGGCKGGGSASGGGGGASGASQLPGPLAPNAGGTSNASSYASSAGDVEVARIAGRSITERQLRDPLVEAYGLNVLLNLVQLQLAQREADRAHLVVTDADVAAERQRTVERMFAQSNAAELEKIDKARATDPAGADKLLAELRKSNEASLDQLLAQQRVSRPEFDIVIRTNATLSKVVEPQVTLAITDEKVQDAYRVQYGEKVKVRHIQVNNLADLNAARRRLAAGEDFATVAKEVSTNPVTAQLGGEVPAFTRNNTGFPQSFRDAAFNLKVGDVSEAVQADGAFHLIKLEQRIEPTVVKFEDVRESVRADLHDKLLQAAVRNLRQQLAQEALSSLTINDPTLKRQFDAKLDQQQAKERDRQAIREELTRQREAAATQQAADLAATTAATQPTTTTTTTASSTAPTTTPPTTTSHGGKTFVDDLLPSTMPAPMKSPLPDDAPPSTTPASTTPMP